MLDPPSAKPFVFTRPAPAVPPTTRAPLSFRATLTDSTTQLFVATGTPTPIVAITLVTPAPSFLKAARLEISADGERWEPLAASAALFRQFGAQQLRFDLQRRTASHLRVTIDDSRSRAVPFTGALLNSPARHHPRSRAVAVRLVRARLRSPC